MKTKHSVLLFGLFSALGANALAHDTDIYINTTSSTSASAPLVMFSLDLRANTGSSSCSSSGGTSDPCNFLRVASGGLGPYLPTTGTVSRFELYKGVLQYVLDRTEGIKVGLMASHNHQSNCEGPRATVPPSNSQKCSNGGYILSGFEPVDTRTNFTTKLSALSEPATGSEAHSYQGRELFFELFRYLTGQRLYNGQNGWTDKGSNNSTNMNTSTDAAYARRWDSTILTGTPPNAAYTSPLTADTTCAKIYTVNVLFGVSQQDADSDTAISAGTLFGGLGVNTNTTSPYNTYNDGFPQIVRWMYDNDLGNGNFGTVPDLSGTQNVTSYFITADSNTSTRAYASAGQGLNTGATPYVMDGDPQNLANQLVSIFQQILSVSTSFTSPSIAVNVYNRSQVLADVYIAMFQAPEDSKPVWGGNLKKYKITNGALQDAIGASAVAAADGRVDYSALSYWTDAATLPAPDPDLDEIAGKDGRSVMRGGCGQRIPGFVSGTPGLTNPSGATGLTSARKLFTEPDSYTNGTVASLRALNADTATASALYTGNHFSAATTAAGDCLASDTDTYSACNLIKYARGLGDDGTTKRNWLVADPLHSKPLAINYGAINSHTEDNPDIRIVMGTNDGFVRMIRNTSSSGTEEGIEAWGFMPREVLATLATLKANLVTDPVTHPATMDGSPATYIYDADSDGNIEPGDGDKVYLYFGMRRGGKSYYALDVTDPNDPKILWRITKSSGDFAELGQTWSTPRVSRIIVDGTSTPTPVLMFGGGYDPDKDTHAPHVASASVGTNDNEGNAIFIVNAATGALIWKAVQGATAGYDATTKAYSHPSLLDSIPSDITPVDSDGNGLTDRLYVADTGGVVWRVDMKCASPSGIGTTGGATPAALPGCGLDAAGALPWKITPILSVGRHYSSTRSNDRRFFYAPDYVQTTGSDGVAYDAIIIGAGDREDPKSTDTVNYFYMFKDKDVTTGTLSNNTGTPKTHANLGDVTECTPAAPCTSSPPDLTWGWKLRLECPTLTLSACGEKSLATAQTIGGAIFFTTYIPNSGTTSCALTEGTGLLYAVGVQEGEPIGFSSTSNTTLGKNDRLTVLKSGGIPAEIVALGGGQYLRPDLITGSRSVASGIKTFWYKKHRD